MKKTDSKKTGKMLEDCGGIKPLKPMKPIKKTATKKATKKK